MIAAGSAIQGAVGFGVNLFAAPLLVLISHDFVPAPMIVASFVLNLLLIRREQGSHHWGAVRWPLIGSVPGAVLGAWTLRTLDGNGDVLGLFFGGLILLAVLLSASGLHPRPTDPAMLGAGAASGFMGTAVGIGGPPIAMMFQRHAGADVRGALARFFLFGSVVSLALLAVFDRFHVHDLTVGVLLLPGTVLGFVLSGPLARRVDGHHVRVAVLALSAASALATIGQALVHIASR